MPGTIRSLPLVLLSVAALAGCGTQQGGFGGFGPAGDAPPPPAKYQAEEFVGRWGYTAYHKDTDRARTEAQARGQCRQPYTIERGPSGGVMMHLADQRQKTEQRVKGGPGGRTFIGPPEEPPGAPQDREVVSFDGRVLVTRYVDPDAGSRYGNMVYVRCSARS